MSHFKAKNSNNNNNNNINNNNNNKSRFREQNGVVGLGIVVALNNESSSSSGHNNNNNNNNNNMNMNNMNTQNPVFAVSPRSDPIPIFSKKGVEIELLEEYTCVITHVGNNMVKKREYFDDGIKRRTRVSDWVGCGGSGVFCSPSPPVVIGGGGVVFDDVDFLSRCNLCEKKLHGLDIFMYRGEKAFCSEECRYQQISIDEHKEKYASRVKKQPEYVETLCSSPMQLPAGMAVA